MYPSQPRCDAAHAFCATLTNGVRARVNRDAIIIVSLQLAAATNAVIPCFETARQTVLEM